MNDGRLCRRLSRKELQQCCKKFGLPSRKSTSVMEESLRSHLQSGCTLSTMKCDEKQHVQLCPFNKSIPMPPFVPFSHFEVQLGFCGNASADSFEVSMKRNECSKITESFGSIGARACRGCNSSSKAYLDGIINVNSESSQPLKSFQFVDGSMNNKDSVKISKTTCRCGGIQATKGTCPSDYVSHPVSTSSFFQVHFSSDEGINLYIDLNSKPSDWVEKCKDEVNKYQNSNNAKAGNFQVNLCGITKSGESSKSLENRKKNKISLAVRAQGYLSSPNLEQHSTSITSNLDGGRLQLLPIQNSQQNILLESSRCSQQANVPMSCDSDKRKSKRRSGKKDTDSTVNRTPTEKTASNLSACFTSNGLSKPSRSKLQREMVCHSSTMQQLDAGNLRGNAKYENSDKDPSSYSRENDAFGNCVSLCSEEQGRGSNANGRANSVSSHVDESIGMIDANNKSSKKRIRSDSKAELVKIKNHSPVVVPRRSARLTSKKGSRQSSPSGNHSKERSTV